MEYKYNLILYDFLLCYLFFIYHFSMNVFLLFLGNYCFELIDLVIHVSHSIKNWDFFH